MEFSVIDFCPICTEEASILLEYSSFTLKRERQQIREKKRGKVEDNGSNKQNVGYLVNI